mgnify:FL=1
MDNRIVKLVGIPWVLGGRDYTGADCVGLFLLAQRDLFSRPIQGEWLYDEATYADMSHTIPGELLRLGFSEAPFPAMDGDAIVIRIARHMHLGTVVAGHLLQTAENGKSAWGRLPRSGSRVTLYRYVRG